MRGKMMLTGPGGTRKEMIGKGATPHVSDGDIVACLLLQFRVINYIIEIAAIRYQVDGAWGDEVLV